MITRKEKLAAAKLLKFLKEYETENKETVEKFLREISNRDIITKKTNPEVIIRYCQNNRSGIFEAQSIIGLNEYITAKVCNPGYLLGDLFLPFDKVQLVEFCDEMTDRKNHCGLGLDMMEHEEVESEIFYEICESLEAYMESFEPLKPKEFEGAPDGRLDKFTEYAERLLVQKKKTNNPFVKLSFKRFTYFGDKTETFYMKLSELLTALKKGIQLENGTPVSELEIQGVISGYSNYLLYIREDIDDEHAAQFLERFEKTDPVKFIEDNFETVKEQYLNL